MRLLLVLWWFIKITSIFVGALIGLLVLILLVVLISPIHYKMNVRKNEEFFIQFQVTWLHKLIQYRYRWQERKKQQIDIYFLGRKRSKVKTEEKTLAPKEQPEVKIQEKREYEQVQDQRLKKTEGKGPEKAKKVEKPKKPGQKRNMKKIIEEYPYKIDLIKDTYGLIKNLIGDLLPDHYQLNWEFGLEDPGNTGYALGMMSMIIPFLGEDVHIKGNFQEEIMQGTCQIRGTIKIGGILKRIATFIWRPPVRKLIKIYLKQRKEGE